MGNLVFQVLLRVFIFLFLLDHLGEGVLDSLEDFQEGLGPLLEFCTDDLESVYNFWALFVLAQGYVEGSPVGVGKGLDVLDGKFCLSLGVQVQRFSR